VTSEQKRYWRSKETSKFLLGLVPERHKWEELTDDEQIALRVLETHIKFRLRESRRHAPFTGGCTFMTPKHIQSLLIRLRYPLRGIHFARHLRQLLLEMGAIEETGKHLKPARQPNSHPEKTYYWKLYLVPALQYLLEQFRPLGAYDSGHVPAVPKHLVSLSSALRCQGVIRKIRGASEFSKGSVQAAFAATGPP